MYKNQDNTENNYIVVLVSYIKYVDDGVSIELFYQNKSIIVLSTYRSGNLLTLNASENVQSLLELLRYSSLISIFVDKNSKSMTHKMTLYIFH